MDPLSAIGAVASVFQLAQAALSLSKSLYELGSTVSSAAEDVQILADDLRTFSQSLTLLSRLLEDSKCWYSDDIYLLTAKIIRDCAELYVKIDKILVKLGNNGKNNWKLRVKFVYKEGQIRKLLSRLRDMKGTLATILMSLQVDLQLSLLNISSPSKIQRVPEKPLQPETIKGLELAVEAVEAGGFLPKYVAETECHGLREEQAYTSTISRKPSKRDKVNDSTSSLNNVHLPSSALSIKKCQPLGDMLQSFVVIPNVREKNSSADIKRSSSIESLAESFKSAVSIQDIDYDVARRIKGIQKIMHAFDTALEILENLIRRHLSTKDKELFTAAKELKRTLYKKSQDIDKTHIHHYRSLREDYLRAFTENHLESLNRFSSMLMHGIVMKLHEYAAEHEELLPFHFECLCNRTNQYAQHISECLDSISSNTPLPNRVSGTGTQVATMDPHTRTVRYTEGHSTGTANTLPLLDKGIYPEFGYSADDERPRVIAPEISLPFIGYTFKRFDNFNLDRIQPPYSTFTQVEFSPVTPFNDSPTQKNQCKTQSPRSESFIPPVTTQNAPSLEKGFGTKDYQPSQDFLDHLSDQKTPLQDFNFYPPHNEMRDSRAFIFLANTDAPFPDDFPRHIPREEPLKVLDYAHLVSSALTPSAASQELPPNPTTLDIDETESECNPNKTLTCISLEKDYQWPSQRRVRSKRDRPSHEMPWDEVGIDWETSIGSRRMLSKNSLSQGVDLISTNLPKKAGIEDIPASDFETWDRKSEGSESEERKDHATSQEDEDKIDISTVKITMSKETESNSILLNSCKGYFINFKQFDRIHKRRVARNNLKAQLVAATTTATETNTTSLSVPLPLYTEQELTWTYPALTTSQISKVWWQAYLSLIAFSSLQSKHFNILKCELEDELEVSPNTGVTDSVLAQRVSSEFRDLTMLECDGGSGSEKQKVLDIRNNISRIVQAVDQQMGLEVAVLGWSYVWVFLDIHEPLFFSNTTSPTVLSVAERSYTHLQTIVATIARYAVMENLYQQSGSALSLKPEYRISLVSLCSSMLDFFAVSFVLGRKLIRLQGDLSSIENEMRICDELMEQIKLKDQQCQSFKVVVESTNWDEVVGMDTEDITDGSWEEISDVELESEIA